MVGPIDVSSLLPVSMLGIYIHAVFLSITLGLPWVIGGLLFKWWRTGDEEYYGAARTVTGVLALNFALGAITGTLVEFGLVQAWPGTIFAIATFAFVPLTVELVAFIGEIVFLILFIVTLKRVSPPVSIGIIGIYLVLAAFSGVVITSVNSWLNVPWGTESLASTLYPFLPDYGPPAADLTALVKVKTTLVNSVLATGTASQVLQDPGVAQTVGLTLEDPLVALASPYNAISVAHAVNAAMIIGMSIALGGYTFRYLRTGNDRYVRIIRAFLPVLLVLLVIEPTILGDTMGKAVAQHQPTKLAMMEGAAVTRQDPLVGFLAYGDPNHPVIGFDTFEAACEDLKGVTLSDVVASVAPGFDAGNAGSLDMGELCLSDVSKAKSRIGIINTGYYAKITAGVVAFVSVIALSAFTFRLGPLSRLVRRILKPLGERKGVFLLALLVLLGAVSAGSLGWFVREVGRKPWTVYGLLYPEEMITPVPVDPIVLAFFILAFTGMAALGLYGMYIVASKPVKFAELLKKGAGVE